MFRGAQFCPPVWVLPICVALNSQLSLQNQEILGEEKAFFPVEIAKSRNSWRKLVFRIEHTEEYVIEEKLASNVEDRRFSDLNILLKSFSMFMISKHTIPPGDSHGQEINKESSKKSYEKSSS